MRITTIVLLFFGICFMPARSQATHALGGEISYEAVAPGVFLGTYVGYFHLGGGIVQPATVPFTLQAPGCNPGTAFTGTLQSNQHFNLNFTPNRRCGAPQDSVRRVVYTASFALPNTQPQCNDWYLSVREPNKSVVANIANPIHDLYLEAYLNPFTVALGQSSPIFHWPNSLVFNVNKPATYSLMAKRDTLRQDFIVYSLKPAAGAHNSPLTYAPGLSFLQPLPTVSGVSLHPLTGQLTFTPSLYNAAGNNAYIIVAEAAVYRKVAGQVRKVAAAQRNLPVFIVNEPANANPEFINVTANGQPVQPNQVVTVAGGNLLHFQFGTADANAADSLRVFSNPAEFNSLPKCFVNFTLGATRPVVNYTFHTRPAATDQVYYFTVSVADNACPTRGITTHAYGFKVLANPLGQRENQITDASFRAFPNPFSRNVTFSITGQEKATEVQIFNLLGQHLETIAVGGASLGPEKEARWQPDPRLAAGTYVARLVVAGKVRQTIKFIKQ